MRPDWRVYLSSRLTRANSTKAPPVHGSLRGVYGMDAAGARSANRRAGRRCHPLLASPAIGGEDETEIRRIGVEIGLSELSGMAIKMHIAQAKGGWTCPAADL